MLRTILTAIFFALLAHPVLAAEIVGEAAGEVVAKGKILNSHISIRGKYPSFIYSVAYKGNLYYCLQHKDGYIACGYSDK